MDNEKNKNKEDSTFSFDGQDFNFAVNNETYSSQPIGRRQKLLLSLVLILSLSAIIGGFWRINRTLFIPYGSDGETPRVQQVAKSTVEDISEVDKETLKKRDTDGDGINDFEEIYVYGTSAYLTDSDSDGQDDLAEVKVGEDPTCATGKICFTSSESAEKFVSQSQSVQENSNSGTASSAEDPILQLTAPQLRKMLEDSGKINKSDLDSIDDQALMQMFNQMLADNPDMATQLRAQLSGQSAQSSEAVDINEIQSIEQLKNLSTEQIKNILVETGGVTMEDLNKLDDESLRSLYFEALTTAQEKMQNTQSENQ